MEYRVIDNRYPIVIDNLIDEARNTQLSIIMNRSIDTWISVKIFHFLPFSIFIDQSIRGSWNATRMIRIIIVIDERETNILVSNALEISLISYANRMQISTFLPYARTGVKKKKKERICAQLSSSSRYLYVRYEDLWGHGWTVDTWIYRPHVSLSRKPFNGRHYRYCIAFEPRSGTPIQQGCNFADDPRNKRQGERR